MVSFDQTDNTKEQSMKMCSISKVNVLVLFLTTIFDLICHTGTDPVLPLKPKRVENATNSDDQVIRPSQEVPTATLCLLPGSNSGGEIMLIEECSTLDMFGIVPPRNVHAYRGSSLLVCCPFKRTIFFPDEFEAALAASTNKDYDDDGTSSSLVDAVGISRIGDVRCTNCVAKNNCSLNDVSNDIPPLYCGWDLQTGEDLFCCEGPASKPPLKEPQKKYGNFPCRDYNSYCQDFAKGDYGTCLPGHPSYPFMRIACMESCGRCGRRGCSDEFSKCDTWARKGHCGRYPLFMTFNCRESCGTCGFRSPHVQRSQIVNGRDYSDIKSPNFFCGESKNKSDTDSTLRQFVPDFLSSRDRRQTSPPSDFKLFYYGTDESNSDRGITCGSVLINDRFVISAAHCDIRFSAVDLDESRVIITRDDSPFMEQIEIRRTFTHPLFKVPQLYYDLSISELGRRVIYDFDKYGDSPACLAQKQSLVGKIATTQGYGYTEESQTSNDLLESMVTVIDNKECASLMSQKTSKRFDARTQLKLTLNKGLNEQLLCTLGVYDDKTKAFSGPCEGDSGGPVYVEINGKQTLVGIVSGGIGCGVDIPTWHTKISEYLPWIECVTSLASSGYSQKTVERFCKFATPEFEVKNTVT